MYAQISTEDFRGREEMHRTKRTWTVLRKRHKQHQTTMAIVGVCLKVVDNCNIAMELWVPYFQTNPNQLSSWNWTRNPTVRPYSACKACNRDPWKPGYTLNSKFMLNWLCEIHWKHLNTIQNHRKPDSMMLHGTYWDVLWDFYEAPYRKLYGPLITRSHAKWSKTISCMVDIDAKCCRCFSTMVLQKHAKSQVSSCSIETSEPALLFPGACETAWIGRAEGRGGTAPCTTAWWASHSFKWRASRRFWRENRWNIFETWEFWCPTIWR